MVIKKPMVMQSSLNIEVYVRCAIGIPNSLLISVKCTPEGNSDNVLIRYVNVGMHKN